jgi:hypothetical protein
VAAGKLSLFPLFPLFPYFHNLPEKLFWLGFYETAGTAGTAGTVVFYRLPAPVFSGRFSWMQNITNGQHLNGGISTNSIKMSI